MLKIGDFSKLSQVTVKTLRYYDEVGLLKPAQVDDFTSYRYYSVDQLPRLNRILALKDLGLSLEQIGQLLDERLPPAQIRGMLRLKQAEIQQRVQDEQARLARVAARLKQIEQEDTMPTYDVVLKPVEPVLVASVRQTLQSYPQVGQLIGEVYGHLEQFGAGGICAAIWHDEEYKDHDIDGEGVVLIDRRVPEGQRVKVYELPAATMATAVHHGSYSNFSQAYNAILSWIETNGYRIVGPNREVYLKGGGAQDDESFVTEIQFPVEKG
jgi:effector-binding domain-containing protein